MNKKLDYRNYKSETDIIKLVESLGVKTISEVKKTENENDISDNDDIETIDNTEDIDIKKSKNKNLKVNPWGDVYKEVLYADIENTNFNNIFKNIILLTNSRNPDDNKTLQNLLESIKELNGIKPKLYIFVAEDVYFEDEGDTLLIKDDKEEILLEQESNIDTLVITRLGVQGEEECEHLISTLQDWGFFVLNPIAYAKRASNKYNTATLLEKAKLPQPKFTLMTKADLDDEKTYIDNLKRIYEDWGENEETDDSREFVCKILDGHGGTGVFLMNGKQLRAIFQAIFAIEPEQQLLLQDKKEAIDGDLRIHVLTLRNKQIILGAMKRKKVNKSDFRSNVSLGAEAVEVKLTPEQEQIALKAAEISKLPWAAVDIMPIKNDANYKDVILELNASPGTDGISDVIDCNFISLLINELDDPNEFFIQDKIAGFRECIDVKLGDKKDDILNLLAKLDTGNGAHSSTLGVEKMDVKNKNITFTLLDENGKEKTYTYKIERQEYVMVGNVKEERNIILIPEICIGKRKLTNVPFAIKADRKKSTHVLINRDVLSRLAYVVSSDAVHILTPEKEMLKLK